MNEKAFRFAQVC